jgi:hypothetical protein
VLARQALRDIGARLNTASSKAAISHLHARELVRAESSAAAFDDAWRALRPSLIRFEAAGRRSCATEPAATVRGQPRQRPAPRIRDRR